jgi:alpha-glucosidase
MMHVMRFWLDKGVDGFRVDVMWHMIKDKQLRNNPVAKDTPFNVNDLIYEYYDPVYSTDQPEVHDIVRMMREVTDAYEERVLIGEIYLPIHKLVTYYGPNNDGAHLPFNFQLLNLPWDAQQIARAIDEYEGALPVEGWPNWVLGNHDQPRISSRVGRSQARVAAMLLLTLRGTPTIYYGDEIGMRDVPIPMEEVVDPQGLNMPDRNVSRDPSRTPMQWNNDDNAGFSNVKPWLRLPDNFKRINVETQKKDDHSMLSFYKRLIMIRKKEKALHSGSYTPLYSDKQIISFIREKDNDRFLIILNMSHRPCYFRHIQTQFRGEILISTETDRKCSSIAGTITLSGDEGILIRLQDDSKAAADS